MSSGFLNFFSRLKFLDIVVFALFLAVTVFSFTAAYRNADSHKEIVIHTPAGIFAYDMAKDRTIQVHGRLGVSTIEIANGAVHFVDSPCPNKTCVYAHPISEAGEWAACLPNQVFIRIESTASKSVDAIAN
ncbi:MAG: NusG domain II-containing protein [Treponema sp.]|nr:NusG domain II-containing protein [Treponema sp.]